MIIDSKNVLAFNIFTFILKKKHRWRRRRRFLSVLRTVNYDFTSRPDDRYLFKRTLKIVLYCSKTQPQAGNSIPGPSSERLKGIHP